MRMALYAWGAQALFISAALIFTAVDSAASGYCARLMQGPPLCGWPGIAFDWQQGWSGAIAAVTASIAAAYTVWATRRAAQDQITSVRYDTKLKPIEEERSALISHRHRLQATRRNFQPIIVRTQPFVDAVESIGTDEFLSWSFEGPRPSPPRYTVYFGDNEWWNAFGWPIYLSCAYTAVPGIPINDGRSPADFDKTALDADAINLFERFHHEALKIGDIRSFEPANVNSSPTTLLRGFLALRSTDQLAMEVEDKLVRMIADLDRRAAPYEAWFAKHLRPMD